MLWERERWVGAVERKNGGRGRDMVPVADMSERMKEQVESGKMWEKI